MKLPGVKVNRREFLLKTFDNYTNNSTINIIDVLERGPAKVGVSIQIPFTVFPKSQLP
ncbi:MAG: hypothetical protein ACREV6_04630 [Clostridium sp.]|uniref:hypothetical protein n=1 Tax=Clostridium sp. TaxID=1506 RepID=UPI003D6D5FED